MIGASEVSPSWTGASDALSRNVRLDVLLLVPTAETLLNVFSSMVTVSAFASRKAVVAPCLLPHESLS